MKTLLFAFLCLPCFGTTYYISKSLGSDSNSAAQAQSKSTPWAHVRGMPSCTSNCSAHTPTAGDSFILYGGDSWTAGDQEWLWQWSGSSGSCALPYGSGATSTCIYIGVDKTWYNASVCGASWCRPILNGGGSATGGSIVSQFHIVSSESYVVLDNIEFTNLYQSATSGEYHNVMTESGNVEIMNNYMHGWSRQNGIPNDDGQDFGVNVNASCCGQSGLPNIYIHNNVIDGSDTTQDMWNGVNGGDHVYNNFVQYVCSNFRGDFTDFHGNTAQHNVLCWNADHANLMFIFGLWGSATTGYFYNNIAANGIGMGSEVFWLIGNSSCSGCTIYGYNNLIWNAGRGFDIGGHPGSGPFGTFNMYNNTVQADGNHCVGNGEVQSGQSTTNYENMHCINGTTCDATGTTCNNLGGLLAQTTAQSNANSSPHFDQYTSSEMYAYSPVAVTNSTVGAGNNLTGSCSGSLASLCSDTTYATEDVSAHVVAMRSTNPRPSSGAWDIGAYEFGGATAPTVTSTSATSITTTTAVLGANATSDGGASITARGVAYGTSSNPTTPCTGDGTGTGVFSGTVTGLIPGTLYHIRGCATNSVGTAYDSDTTFTTSTTSVQTVTGVTNTQAVLRIRTAQAASTCIIAATETVSGDTPHDIDTSLFASSNVGNRSSSVVNGQDISFVLGTRGPAFQALDGQWYSRALAAATAYSGTVTCNSDPAVAFSFTTQTIPVGVAYYEGNYFNAAAFGNYAVPTFHLDNLATQYIDPQTGMKFKLLTGPGQFKEQLNTLTGASGTTTNPGDVIQSVLQNTNWSNSANAFTTGGSFASYTASAQDVLMLRFYSTQGGNGVYTCNWEVSIAGSYCGFSIDGNSLSLQGNGGGSTIQVDVALSWNGVSQGSEWETITLPASTGTVTYPASGLGTLSNWQGTNFPLIPAIYFQVVEQRYAVSTVGTAVTILNPAPGGACFSLDPRVLTAGSKITIVSTEYTIASVDACEKLTLTTSAGTNPSVFAYTSNLSVMIRKHSATSGTVNVNSVQVQVGWSFNFGNGGTGDFDFCAPTATTNASGKGIEMCSFPTAISPASLFAVNTTDLSANWIATSALPASSLGVPQDEYNAATWDNPSIWSATDPNTFYLSATLTANGHVTLVKGVYGYNGTTCNYQAISSTYGAFVTNPCITFTEITKPSLGLDITSQLTAPSLTSGKFPQPVLSFVQDNKAVFTAQNNQNTEAWIVSVDLTSGLVLGQFSSYMNTGTNSCRFCPLHAALAANATDTYYYEILENYDLGGTVTGGGPYEVTSLTNLTTTPGINVATCQATIGTTAITTGTWAANSTTITVASAAGIANGNFVIAVGIPPTAVVTNVSGTTITISATTPTQAVGASAAITFSASAVYWMVAYSAGCDNVTFNATDNIPCDPDPSTWELANMPMCTGQSQTTWRQFEGGAYQVGDWMWDVTQGTFFDNMVIGKLNSGSTWTILRAVNLPQGYSMALSCCIMTTSHTSGDLWQMVCSFQINAIVSTAEVNGSGLLWDRKLYAFNHGTLRTPGIITAEFFSNTSTNGASYRAGAYPSAANLPQTNRIDGNAPFAGAVGVGVGAYVQSHLAFNAATSNSYVDQSPLAPSSGGSQYLWTQLGATNLGGCLWKIPIANAVDPPQKRFLPQMWWTGQYALKDVSGTGTINGDCSFKACSIDYSGDTCGQSMESVGDVFINAPYITNDTTTGRMYDVNSLNSAPAGVEPLAVLQYYQTLLEPNGPYGVGQTERRLTTGGARYNGQNSYANAKTLPGAPSILTFECATANLQMINALCISNMPADPGLSSIPHNTFVPLSISIPGVSGMTVRANFWYAETGGFCTSRQEQCYTANSPITFVWAGETQAYTSCSSACTVQIPAIPGRTLYYSIHRKFGGADIVDPTQVAVVN